MNQQDDNPLAQRQAGVLLHITSLPGAGSCGDLGQEAFHFVDFLRQCGCGVWQMLPIGPTGQDGSPYQSSSSHAGNYRLIALAPLVESGWLAPQTVHHPVHSDDEKRAALHAAWSGFQHHAHPEEREELRHFSQEQAFWLDDYALFRAIHEEMQRGWWEWPKPLRDRDHAAIAGARTRLHGAIEYIRFEQFVFFRQWLRLKAYANQAGIGLFGDMPIFVAHDSAEVWAHRPLFLLKPDGSPKVVAGVPPDYFSATGQRWGNPLYDWPKIEKEGFRFWIDRLKTQLHLFDLIRIDHFRGFEAYWEIPAEDPTAVNGRWVTAPGDALFERLHQIYAPLPLVAEDLGIITPEVEELRDRYKLPGMRILQFAFSGEATNPYLPFHYPKNTVAYTGTHDNDTTVGWHHNLDDHTRGLVNEYLGFPSEPMPWALIRAALASHANLAIVPMQDLLGLDGYHRMNMPGTTQGNWQWRFDWHQVPHDLAGRVRRLLEVYGRLPAVEPVKEKR